MPLGLDAPASPTSLLWVGFSSSSQGGVGAGSPPVTRWEESSLFLMFPAKVLGAHLLDGAPSPDSGGAGRPPDPQWGRRPDGKIRVLVLEQQMQVPCRS